MMDVSLVWYFVTVDRIYSGREGGRFFKRGKLYKSEGTNVPYLESDFSLGAEVKVKGLALKLMEADAYTETYMQCGAQLSATA